jgi:nucleotide-binding universal stress UspA family protein
MYRRILVPLDGSAFSESVLDHVEAVAAGCSSPTVLFLTVIEPYRCQAARIEGLELKIQKEARAAAEKYLNGIVARFKGSGLNAEAVIIDGLPAESILDYAEKNPIDLIIMGTHCRAGLDRLFLGSVANKVVSSSRIPVMLAPPGSLKTTR